MIKVIRSYPAPASLSRESQKASGSYSKEDVVKQLQKDFHDKCYICELKGLQDPQVEHLKPHKNGLYHDLKFDWENLFWCCAHCNSIKNRKVYDEHILDCCKVDPEQYIYFRKSEKDVDISPKVENDEARITAQLVSDVFNLRNSGMRTITSTQRLRELEKEMNALYDTLEKYRKNPNAIITLKKLEALLRKESAFAGFKRCYIREHIDQYPDLKSFIQ